MAKHKDEVADRQTAEFSDLVGRLLESGIKPDKLKEIIDIKAEERGNT